MVTYKKEKITNLKCNILCRFVNCEGITSSKNEDKDIREVYPDVCKWNNDVAKAGKAHLGNIDILPAFTPSGDYIDIINIYVYEKYRKGRCALNFDALCVAIDKIKANYNTLEHITLAFPYHTDDGGTADMKNIKMANIVERALGYHNWDVVFAKYVVK